MPDQVITNEYGEVVLISHPTTQQQPDAFTTGGTPTQLANAYISDRMAEMGLAQSRLESDEAAMFAADRENDPVISVSGEKDIAGSTVVYEQSVMDMPMTTPVLCRIEIELPRFLRRLGWELHIVSEGSAKFEMRPRDRREVMLNIEPGQQFSLDVARRAIAEGDHEIKVFTSLDDELSGGMTYQLSFDASDDDGDEQPPPRREPPRRVVTIEEILRILRENFPSAAALPAGRRIRTVRLELDLFDDDTPGDA